ncbi:hypothetical protein WA158_003664 [Blastocystis sp. Blastoise]
MDYYNRPYPNKRPAPYDRQTKNIRSEHSNFSYGRDRTYEVNFEQDSRYPMRPMTDRDPTLYPTRDYQNPRYMPPRSNMRPVQNIDNRPRVPTNVRPKEHGAYPRSTWTANKYERPIKNHIQHDSSYLREDTYSLDVIEKQVSKEAKEKRALLLDKIKQELEATKYKPRF